MQCICSAIDLSSARNGLPSESNTFKKLKSESDSFVKNKMFLCLFNSGGQPLLATINEEHNSTLRPEL